MPVVSIANNNKYLILCEFTIKSVHQVPLLNSSFRLSAEPATNVGGGIDGGISDRFNLESRLVRSSSIWNRKEETS